MKSFLTLLTIILVIYLFGCDNKSKVSENELDEIHFNLDTNLLGEKTVNSINSFEFYIPKLLTNSETDFYDLENQLSSSLPESINLLLLYVFTDSAKENSLSISKIILPVDLSSNNIDSYSEAMGNTYLFKNASKAKYLKDGMIFSQFITNHNNFVIIKIIFQPKENNLIQFDYIFNEENYKQEVRSIESSIGSIKIL